MNSLQPWLISFATAFLLAAVALAAYTLGRRPWRLQGGKSFRHGEVDRALAVAKELEAAVGRIGSALSSHSRTVATFRRRLKRMERGPSIPWEDICDQADELLKPTLRFSGEMSHAYAEILRQVAHLASFAELRADPLTGALNRRAFDEILDACIQERKQLAEPLSVAMIDVDHFKQVNDRNGHLFGDRMLQELAALLKANVRECDWVARYGGEEFVVIMPRSELAAACQLAEQLRSATEANLPLTISVGLASCQTDDNNASLVAKADRALYAAKQSGRNNVHLHEGPSGHIVGIRMRDNTGEQPEFLRVVFPKAEPVELAVRSEAC
jgi:diguanylate cyclase (GGDEF)-like protein